LQDHEGSLRRGTALIFQDLAQRDALDQFHDDSGTRWGCDVFVQPDDVQVIQGGQNARLAAEHLGEFGIGQQVMAQVFDRYQDA
jgi:hypothetical protein